PFLHVQETQGKRVVRGRGSAARGEGKNLETARVAIGSGVEMDADENGIARLVGNVGPKLEREKNIVLARHDYFESPGLEKWTQPASNIEGILLLESVPAARPLVETAVAGIEHHGLDFAFVLDHVGPQLRLDCFCEIDARDEKFPVLRENRK